MARETEKPAPLQSNAKTGFGPQTPLQLAERRRALQSQKAPENPGQIFTDWALI